MKCTKSLVYAGKRYQVGDELEVTSKQDAKILAAIRKAVRAPESPVPAWQPVAEEARKKRTYTRRDLVAEPTPRTVLVETPPLSAPEVSDSKE